MTEVVGKPEVVEVRPDETCQVNSVCASVSEVALWNEGNIFYVIYM